MRGSVGGTNGNVICSGEIETAISKILLHGTHVNGALWGSFDWGSISTSVEIWRESPKSIPVFGKVSEYQILTNIYFCATWLTKQQSTYRIPILFKEDLAR